MVAAGSAAVTRLAADRSAQGIISALRAGAFWADHGLILDALALEASVPGLDRPATPGETLAVRPDDVVRLQLTIARGPGASDAPLDIELIESCTTGTPRLSLEGTLLPGDNRFEKRLTNLQTGADKRTCYVRARLRKALHAAPDLMAYTNPIRFRID